MPDRIAHHGSTAWWISFIVATVLLAWPASVSAAVLFPLKPSANNRYLVDQNNVPFLMVGDSPQALIGNLSKAQAREFMNNRRDYGVNTLWINLLCADYTACHLDGTTYDSIAPFTEGSGPSDYNLSKP